ncbi:MAG: methyltransferase domain-containing protein, partial [Chloroflexota bacterium]|nr:methyltransferase domain-containing protein [Chloroflexota bacterium]
MEHHSLEWIDEASSREEFEGRYDEWGSTYDTDLVVAWEYKLPSFIGDLFMKYAQDRNARILDAGAGTGLGGAYISRHGYNNLTGIDMSQGMLAEAERKGIYRTLERMVLGKVLDFADDYFDAVLSVGTIGHAP